MVEVRHYVTRAGVDVLAEWLAELSDDHARARIANRIDRLSRGNFGDRKSLGGDSASSESTGAQAIASITR
jgi:putative component of toxin-antitoxin plasmid stabilization module